VHAVPVAGHAHHLPESLAGIAASVGLRSGPATGLFDALEQISGQAEPAAPPIVLIAGSLYLAGEALTLNETPPD
jgi:dihydrofolate synthase/folylpolyglutamate synthase